MWKPGSGGDKLGRFYAPAAKLNDFFHQMQVGQVETSIWQ